MSPNSSVGFIIIIVDGSPVHYDSTVIHALYSTRIGGPGAVSGWTVGGGGGVGVICYGTPAWKIELSGVGRFEAYQSPPPLLAVQ